MATHQADRLIVICLNNYGPIEHAYGVQAARGAIEHLQQMAARYFGRVTVHGVHRHEIQLLVRHAPLRCLPGGTTAETLCAILGEESYRWGEDDILLAVIAGDAVIDGAMNDVHLAKARQRLSVSILRDAQVVSRSAEAAARYRKDMTTGAELLRMVHRGAAFFTWRSVAQPDDPGIILYHEAVLRRIGHMGEQIDCADGYAALERLGMAHLLDRRFLSEVVDELENDPVACLSVAISSQSLSLNLQGEETGWNDAIERLRRDPGLARRLVIEIADNSGMRSFHDAVTFVRLLRELGVRIAIGHFGSGHASIGQLMALSPDAVKLDSAFMPTAYQSERNRMRIGHLIGLARTMSPIVILDGVESPWHLHLAKEEGAQWIAGSQLGQPRQRRSRHNSDQGAAVAYLTAFNSGLEALSVKAHRLGS